MILNKSVLFLKLVSTTCIFVVFTSCTKLKNNDVKIELPQNFYKIFEGKIGELPISIELNKSDSLFEGYYYYNKIGNLLRVYGNYNKDNTITLKEFDNNSNQTGEFNGIFSDINTFKGTWTDNNSKKSFPFLLTYKSDGFLSFSFENLENENCIQANKNKENFTEEMMAFDTLCSTISLKKIIINSTDQTVSENINKNLQIEICGINKADSTTKSYQDLIDLKNGEASEQTIVLNMILNNEKNICIKKKFYYYSFGAAHGLGMCQYYNFDPKTGILLTLDNLFVNDYQTKLNSIGKNQFVKQNGKEGWFFDSEKQPFKLNQNFALFPGGIKFQFQHYEIGPYVAGLPEVFIPFSKIKNLLTEKAKKQFLK